MFEWAWSEAEWKVFEAVLVWFALEWVLSLVGWAWFGWAWSHAEWVLFVVVLV